MVDNFYEPLLRKRSEEPSTEIGALSLIALTEVTQIHSLNVSHYVQQKKKEKKMIKMKNKKLEIETDVEEIHAYLADSLAEGRDELSYI